MASAKKARRDLAQEIKDVRAAHDKLLKKVEKARAKFEKRNRKLQALEAELAKLEQRYHSPELERLGQAAGGKEVQRRARLIYNPKAGANSSGAKSLENIVGRLRAHGIVAEIGLKTSGKAARELAKEAAQNGEDLVIVAAGDGTIEEVASQLVGTKTAMAIVPTGTMNNLARALGVPLEIEDACALIGMGVTRWIDVGRVIANEKPQVEFFLETAGVGLSAIAIPAGQAAEKGRWADLPKALRKLFESKPTPIVVELENETVQVNSQVVTVSNSPLMGNNILVAPDAKMDDGLLDVAVYDGMSKKGLLGYFVSAANGKRAENAKVRYYRSRRVRIKSDEPIDAHSDKDVIDSKQVLGIAATSGGGNSQNSGRERSTEPKFVLEIEVMPNALSMVVGKGIALT